MYARYTYERTITCVKDAHSSVEQIDGAGACVPHLCLSERDFEDMCKVQYVHVTSS